MRRFPSCDGLLLTSVAPPHTNREPNKCGVSLAFLLCFAGVCSR